MQCLKTHEILQVGGARITSKCECFCEDHISLFPGGWWTSTRMVCYEVCREQGAWFGACYFYDR